MARLEFNKVVLIAMAAVSVGALGELGFALFESSKTALATWKGAGCPGFHS